MRGTKPKLEPKSDSRYEGEPSCGIEASMKEAIWGLCSGTVTALVVSTVNCL